MLFAVTLILPLRLLLLLLAAAAHAALALLLSCGCLTSGCAARCSAITRTHAHEPASTPGCRRLGWWRNSLLARWGSGSARFALLVMGVWRIDLRVAPGAALGTPALDAGQADAGRCWTIVSNHVSWLDILVSPPRRGRACPESTWAQVLAAVFRMPAFVGERCSKRHAGDRSQRRHCAQPRRLFATSRSSVPFAPPTTASLSSEPSALGAAVRCCAVGPSPESARRAGPGAPPA